MHRIPLPQIASKVWLITLIMNDMYANIRILTKDERISAIAQMQSGSQITDAAIENAKVR